MSLFNLSSLFSSEQFMPHGYCYHWIPNLVLLHVISDGTIALAYYLIPFSLAYLVYKRKDIPFDWIFFCFCFFIIACGTSHLMEIWTLWYADYWISGIVKAITAIISIITAILLVKLIPAALALPSPSLLKKTNEALEQEIIIRKQKESELETTNITLQNVLGVAIETASQLEKQNKFKEEALKNHLESNKQLAEQTHALELQKAKTETTRFAKDLLQNILESSIEYSIIATDLEGKILVWNEGAHRNYGYTADEVMNKNVLLVHTPQDIQSGVSQQFFDAAHEEKGAVGIFERVRKDGSTFFASVAATLRRDSAGIPNGYTIISKDITKQKQLEEQYLRSNQELEKFAYITSHDLKAPLRAIERLASWIEEDEGNKLSDESKENLVRLRQRVNRMSNLITGILQYSRAGRGDVNIEMVDTKQLLREIIDTLHPSPNFTIRYADNLPTLETDKVLLGQVFSNIISNSIKYHHRDTGNIEIGVRDSENFYAFFVKDDGPGIAQEYHEKVFEIFQTLQSRDEIESTGIGLSIVKKVVESQGGKIIIDSEVGKGTTFCFTWPKSPNKNNV